jgi:NAD kinase
MSTSRFLSSQSTSSFHKVLVVIKQTAYEEYSQLRLRGKAPKALRWKRLENRYKAHKSCVNNLEGVLRHHNVDYECVNRVELDRQHLANVDLVVSVGGDGTALSSAHFLVRFCAFGCFWFMLLHISFIGVLLHILTNFLMIMDCVIF